MSEQKWTGAQQAAIDFSGQNMLVSAAAGSGKTAVMIEKIFNLIIEKKTSADRIVVVTFTNAAASSMRRKLKNKFESEIKKNPKNEYLIQQKRLLERADISTIHSFCQKILKRFYYETKLAPDFTILSETQDNMYTKWAVNKALEFYAKEYEDGNFPQYLDALKIFATEYSDDDLSKNIIKLSKELSNANDVENFRNKLLNSYGDTQNTFFNDYVCDEIDTFAKLFIGYLEKFEKLYYTDENYANVSKCVNNSIEQFNEVFKYNTAEEKINAFSFRKVNASGQSRLTAILKTLFDQRNNLKKKFTGIKSLSPENNKLAYNAVFALLKMTDKFTELYEEKCLEHGAVSFNDILKHTINLFSENERVLEEVKNETDYVFVDEYQDVNTNLEKIVTLIAKENNLFFVGDVKQSIYKFMNANPELFINKTNLYSDGVLGKIFYLSNNFRSTKTILDGINDIFEKCMKEELFEVEYDKNAALYPNPEQNTYQYNDNFFYDGKPENTNEFLISIKNKQNEDGTTRIFSEEEVIAERILKLMQSTIIDPETKEERKVKYNDIVILGCKNESGNKFEDVFRKYGIPFKTKEKYEKASFDIIGAIVSLLKLLVVRRNDDDLIIVLLSGIGRFTLEELAIIRLNTKEKYFYDAMVNFEKNDGVKIRAKIDEFLELLDKLQLLQLTMTLPDFIEYIYNNTGFLYHVAFMDKNYIQENKIEVLIANAKYYCENNAGGLRGFLEYFENIEFKDKDAGSIDKNDDSVHYMTIHKSKGLEYPIVILIDTDKTFFSKSDSKSDFNEKLGICVKIKEKDEKGKSTDISHFGTFAMEIYNRKSTVSEKLRLLYVALTRAQCKVIISIHEESNNIVKKCYPFHPLTAYLSKSWADLLIPMIYESDYGEKFKSYFLGTPYTVKENNLWDINIVDSLINPEVIIQSDEKIDFNDYKKSITDKLSWKYKYFDATKQRTKQNPSKGTEHKKQMLRKPQFTDNDYKGAQKGTIVHFFMEHYDFLSDKSAKEQANDMLYTGVISQEEYKSLPMDKICAFTESEFASRMKKSSRIFKERSFCKILPVNEIGDEALVQGTIDCYFFEENSIILLDYKTDIIHNDLDEHIMHHTNQIKMYKQALEDLYPGKKVVPYLHFFDANQTIEVK